MVTQRVELDARFIELQAQGAELYAEHAEPEAQHAVQPFRLQLKRGLFW